MNQKKKHLKINKMIKKNKKMMNKNNKKMKRIKNLNQFVNLLWITLYIVINSLSRKRTMSLN